MSHIESHRGLGHIPGLPATRPHKPDLRDYMRAFFSYTFSVYVILSLNIFEHQNCIKVQLKFSVPEPLI